MIKVAAIIPPSSRNLGNEFFALGGIESFSQTFSHVEKEISVIEFFDSGENSYGQAKTPLFTDATLDWIKNDADLVVLFGGCCLRSPLNRDTDLKHLFDVLFSTGKPFLGWGLSPTLYTEADVDYAKEVADHPNTLALITRDDIICQKIGDYNKIISGMDGGFWMGESFKGADRSSNYSVVNLEQSNQLDVAESAGNVRELENTIEYSVLMGKEDGVIHGHDLPPTLQTPVAIAATGSNRHTLKARTAMLERDMIVDSLKRHKGTISAAARELGITERMVRYKIQKLDIDYETLFKKRRRRKSTK